MGRLVMRSSQEINIGCKILKWYNKKNNKLNLTKLVECDNIFILVFYSGG